MKMRENEGKVHTDFITTLKNNFQRNEFIIGIKKWRR
jgi:hypothetical protein